MANLTIVGGGIIGMSCAWAAQRRGWKVTVIDRDFEGDRASHGNAGGIAITECIPLSMAGLGLKPLRWLMDPLGPLSVRASHAPRLLPWFLALRKVARPDNFHRIAKALASLNDQSLPAFEAMLGDLNLGGSLHKRGALTVYETRDAFQRDMKEWELKRSLSVRWRAIDAREIRDAEPGLAPVFEQGVMLEDWAHIDDPKALLDALRERVRARGAELVSGLAESISLQDEWHPSIRLVDGRIVAGDKVVVATGAWAAELAKPIGDRVLIESERGYNTTLPNSASRLSREVIFAERKFVATPLSIGLRIGGAAEFAGLDAPANFQRSDALLELARRYLPDLDEAGAKRWMGNRPATPDSLPVIGPSAHTHRVLYAFGHGHLGLTQCASTAELVGHLLDETAPPIDLMPFSISRF